MNESSSQMAVLLFTDLVDSSALKIRLGDMAYARQIAEPHNALFRRLLQCFSEAVEAGYTGDGFMATFARVSDAVNLALLFHEGLRNLKWNSEVKNAAGEAGIRCRIAIHLGEITVIPGANGVANQASHAADMCARVMSLADGGQTFLTRAAFDNARQYVRQHPAPVGEVHQDRPPPEIAWLSHGRFRLKGKEDDPMEVFEVGAKGLAPLRPPKDSEKAQRADSLEEQEMRGWRPAAGQEVPQRPHWRVVEKIGEGGFGEVWLARHDKTQQSRVFKFCFDPDRLRSFKRELTLFRLICDVLGQRDDILPLLDIRLDAPPFFLESEYIAEGNLLQWSERRGGICKVPCHQRLKLVKGVARAVAAAHSVGIIHKDLKPSNIFVRCTPDNGGVRPVLADFGIGAIADQRILEEHGITAAGFTDTLVDPRSSRSGTRLYAPPEAQVGKFATVQGDVYALGVLLYQMLVGDFTRPLAFGWDRDFVQQVRTQNTTAVDVHDNEALNETACELLCEDVRACVEGDPSLRLPSSSQLVDRLEALERRTQQTKEQKRLERVSRNFRVLRTAFTLVSLSTAILGGLLLFGYIQWNAAQTSKLLAEKGQREAEVARIAAEKAGNEAQQQRRIEYARRLAGYSMEQAGQGQLSLLLAIEAADFLHKVGDPVPSSIKENLRQALARIGGGYGVGTKIANFAIDARGQWLVTASSAGVQLWNIHQGMPPADEKTLVADSERKIDFVNVSAGGAWIVAIESLDGSSERYSRCRARLWQRLNDGIFKEHKLNCESRIYAHKTAARFDGPGDTLIVVGFDNSHDGGDLKVFRLEDSGPKAISGLPYFWLSDSGERLHEAAISPDGKKLAVGIEQKGKYNVVIHEFSITNHLVERMKLGDWAPQLTFTYDNRWLLLGSEGGKRFLWDMAASDPESSRVNIDAPFATKTVDSYGYSSRTVVSRNRRWLGVLEIDGELRIWDLTEPNSEPRLLKLPGCQAVRDVDRTVVALSNDAKWITAGDRIWNLSGDIVVWFELNNDKQNSEDIRFSEDGRWLCRLEDGDLRLWSMTPVEGGDEYQRALTIPGRASRSAEDWPAQQVTPGELIALARLAAGRTLTSEERLRFQIED